MSRFQKLNLNQGPETMNKASQSTQSMEVRKTTEWEAQNSFLLIKKTQSFRTSKTILKTKNKMI